MRVLELYAGIGGAAAALADRAQVVAAIEQSDVALSVYRHNYGHPTLEKNLLGLTAPELAAFEADLWWMSPPCQSFTVRGQRRDLDDPRARSFLRVLDLVREVRPRAVALENVPAFSGSRAHALLLETMGALGYRVRERVLCPTELGIPNRRARYYLFASLDHLTEGPISPPPRRPLADFLDRDADGDPELRISALAVEKYRWAMLVLDRQDPAACASCFTSAYGRSPVKSGAYLATREGVRLFSPREILNLFGFPSAYRLPEGLPRARAYGLIGNSLSVPAVRAIMDANGVREARCLGHFFG